MVLAVAPALARRCGECVELVAGAWTQQLSWKNDKHLARFGHRYLSVHYLRPQGEHYREYSKTLKPGVDSWLEAYNEAFRKTAREHAVNIVGFGYVNTFDFEPKDFDLSTYFKLNVGVDVGSNDTGLLGLNTGFQFYDASKEMYLSLTLAAASPTSENSAIQVVTKVVAERRGVQNLSFGDKKELGGAVYEAKEEAAKETFFGFATPKTHAIMGAMSDVTQFDEDRKHDPTNLLLGCDRCNGGGGKGDYHPGHAKRKRLPHDRSGYEIVDIRRDDFAALFAISRNGNIAARPGPTRARTNWNIATLKLDLKKCDERREEVLLLRDRCETACVAAREGSTDKDRQTFKCLLEMMIPELARRYLLLTAYGLPVSNELAQRLARATEELRR